MIAADLISSKLVAPHPCSTTSTLKTESSPDMSPPQQLEDLAKESYLFDDHSVGAKPTLDISKDHSITVLDSHT